MACKDIREFIKLLEGKGELVRYQREVDPAYELSAITKSYDKGPVVLFEKVKGHRAPVVVGLYGTRERIALALGVRASELQDRVLKASKAPIPTKLVSRGRMVAYEGDDVDLARLLPMPIHHALDAGPYITAGVILAKDPDTSARNVSYARMQLKGKSRLAVMVNEWRHLRAIQRKAESASKPLEVAIVVGPPPAVSIEGAMPGGLVPIEQDELDTAGALMGEPLEVIKCKTIDMDVPARSEIILEGEIPPFVRDVESPFGDYSKIYDGIVTPKPALIIEVKAAMLKEDFIYHDILPGSRENLIIGAVGREAEIYRNIKQAVPSVKAVHLTLGGCCRFHAIVQIKKETEADGRSAILAAFLPTEAGRDLKLVIVVEEDIDPFNWEDVEWALATRVQPDRDVIILKGQPGALDPSAIVSTPEKVIRPPPEYGIVGVTLTSKMGIDATRTFKRPEMLKQFERTKVKEIDER